MINNGGGFYSRQVYINACRRRGITILPPEVNAGGLLYTAENGALRVGLGQLKGLSREFLVHLVREREANGPYRDLADLFRRLEPRFAEIRVLIRSGALDEIGGGLSRPQMFWLYYHRSRILDNLLFLSPENPPEGAGSLPLSPSAGEALLQEGLAVAGLPKLEEYSDMNRLADEAEHLQIIISRHPLEIFRPRIRRILASLPDTLSDSRDVSDGEGREILLAGTLVTEKETRTKSRQLMSFVSFEDPHGMFETVFFPDSYEANASPLEEGSAFLIRGMVEKEFGVCQIQVKELIPLSRVEL